MLAAINGKIIFYDLMRAAAMAAIVYGHTLAAFVYKYGQMPLSGWMALNVIDSFLRCCAPMFVMISGGLLLAKRRGYAEFYKKRAAKVMVPALFWTVFYAGWSFAIARGSLSVSEVFWMAIGGNAYYHLWFVYMILGLYVITPFLKIMLDNFCRRDYQYFLLVWAIFALAMPALAQISRYRFSYDPGWGLPMVFAFAGYFVLGYYLSPQAAKSRARVYLATYVALASITAAGTYWFSRHFGALDEFFYGFMTFNVAAQTIAVYFLFKKICAGIDWERRPKTVRFIQTASDLSFGIFLIHPVFLTVFSFLAKSCGLANNLVLFIPAVGTAALLAAAAAAFVIKKIPIVNRLI